MRRAWQAPGIWRSGRRSTTVNDPPDQDHENWPRGRGRSGSGWLRITVILGAFVSIASSNRRERRTHRSRCARSVNVAVTRSDQAKPLGHSQRRPDQGVVPRNSVTPWPRKKSSSTHTCPEHAVRPESRLLRATWSEGSPEDDEGWPAGRPGLTISRGVIFWPCGLPPVERAAGCWRGLQRSPWPIPE